MPCNKVFAVLQTTGEKDLKIVSRCNCKVRLYKKTWKKWNSYQRNHTYCCLSADRDSLFFGHLVSDLLWLSRTLKSISTSLQQVILMFAAVWLWTAKVWTSHVVRVHRTLSKGIGGFAGHCSKSRDSSMGVWKQHKTRWMGFIAAFLYLGYFPVFSANGSRFSVLPLNSEEIFPFRLVWVEHLILGNESDGSLPKPSKQTKSSWLFNCKEGSLNKSVDFCLGLTLGFVWGLH